MSEPKQAISSGILKNSIFEPNDVNCTIYANRDIWNKNSSEFKKRYPNENPDIKKAISYLEDISYNKELISKLL